MGRLSFIEVWVKGVEVFAVKVVLGYAQRLAEAYRMYYKIFVRYMRHSILTLSLVA